MLNHHLIRTSPFGQREIERDSSFSSFIFSHPYTFYTSRFTFYRIFQIPPDPPFLKWGKDFHIHLVLQSSIAGLFWKLSQDSMLIVTPECFYQGSKVN